jgi:putative MATE family efflux protein
MSATPARFDRSLVEGPLRTAVWKLAWPTMLQNMIGGLQGLVDHALVGHFVGYTANAAIGVSWQIFLVVIVFISSLYTGMGVLVARFAGAGDADRVNRTVAQAFLTSLALSVLVMAPLGYVLSPSLLELVNATPEVRAEALPFLRIMFLFSFGMLTFFMISGALRSAGDARSPLRLGVGLTLLNVVLNVVLIRGLGPIPRLGTAGAALGTVLAGTIVSGVAILGIFRGRYVVAFPQGTSFRPDWSIVRALFRFGLPAGVQGVAMNVGGVFLMRYIGSLQQSAQAQAAYAVGYVELFSFITWSSVGLMGATAAVTGMNLGAGRIDRAAQTPRQAATLGLLLAAGIGLLFLTMPAPLLAAFGMRDPVVVGIGTKLLAFLSVSGLFVTVALTYTGALQGTGDTRSPLYISLVSQMAVPLGMCATLSALRGLHPSDIWLAIVLGHATRCVLSVARFRQGKWRSIAVEVGPAPA